MGTNNLPNKTAALALNQKVAEGVDKYFSKVKSITVGGTTYTTKALLAVLNAENDASKVLDSTRAQLKEQVVSHRTAKASAAALRSALKAYVLGTYGKKAVQMLGDFGMSTPKTPSTTVATRANAVAQSLATRKARHTMGKKQKLSIKGTVSTTTGAEAPSPDAPAATPAPAVQATQVAPQVAQAPAPAQTTATH